MRSFIDVIIFIIILPCKLLIYAHQINSNSFSVKSLLMPIIASVLVFLAIGLLLKAAHRFKFLYICNLIISILIICDLNYFRYFKDIISIPVIINSVELGAVGSSVKSLIKYSDFLYLADLAIIPFINRYMNNTKKISKFPSVILLIICVLINFKYFYKLSREQPRLLTTMYNKVYITNSLGVLNYHYIDIYNTACNKINRLAPISKNKISDIQNFINSNKASEKNFHGSYEGKNLIMIQVEALQGFVINSSINGREITPNLNKLIKSSEYFDNFYYQVAAGGTSDAEFMTNNSLYPAQSGAVYFLYSGNTFDSMPKAFYNKGYDTAALHGFRENFWNRDVMYKNFDFKHFYGEKSFKKDEIIGLGLSDRSFLNQSIDKLDNLKSPFYAFLITLSSHFPYDDVNQYGNFDVGNLEDTLMGNYIKSIHYTDEQLGMFLDKLNKSGLLNNSVIVLYGDHYAIPKNKENLFFKFYNKSSISDVDWIKLQKVPLIIHFPDGALKGINHTNSGEMDIYPTMANLFNLPQKYMMGKDLFNSTQGKIIYRNGSFIDGNYYYMSENNTYYNMKTGSKIPETKTLLEKRQSVLDELEYSDSILKHNLIKKLDEK